MADWSTIASLATAGGTLLLAVATFSSTRSANQSARMAERAMLAGLRPLLLTSRPQDLAEKVMWSDEHFAKVLGGQGVAEEIDGVVYLAAGLRNVGAGVAVLHGWHLYVGWDTERPPTDPDRFHRLTRDLYIASGDTGFWQGAIRAPDDPERKAVAEAIAGHERLTVDVLYGDQEGGQRTISRLAFTWHADVWRCATSRHWNLDRDDPR